MRTAVDPPGLGGAPSDLPAGPAGLDVDALRARAEDAVREENLGAAEWLLRRALVISKGAGEDLIRLGRVLEAKGALDAAAECFSEATKADPDAALPARALARVSMALGEFETAGACLSRLLVANPVCVSTRIDLGRAQRAMGDHDGALASFQAAVRQVPGDRDARLELARTWMERGDLAKAAQELQRLPADDPQPEGFLISAQCALLLGHLEVARAELSRAALHALSRAQEERYYALRARLDASAGRAGDGLESLQTAGLIEAPGTADAIEAVVEAAVLSGEGQRARVALTAPLRRPATQLESARIAFARGAMHDAQGQPATAMLCWNQGNHMLRGSWRPDRVERLADDARTWFSKADLGRRFDQSGQWAGAITVVVGAPGSGVGLVTRLLRTGEGAVPLPPGDPVARVRHLLPRRIGRPWPDCLDWLGVHGAARAALKAIGLGRFQTRATGRPVFMLGGHGLFDVGAVSMLLPGARVVLVTRNPWDAGLSQFRRLLRGPGLDYTSSLSHIASMMGVYGEMMDHWRDALPVAPVEVSYDRLARDPEATLAELGATLARPDLPQALDEVAVRADGVDRWMRYARWLGPVGALPG